MAAAELRNKKEEEEEKEPENTQVHCQITSAWQDP